MITQIFTVLDLKAQAYMAPFTTHNAGVACRSVSDSMKQEGSMLAAHPSDFVLYRLGSFDDATGIITPEVQPVLIAQCDQLGG